MVRLEAGTEALVPSKQGGKEALSKQGGRGGLHEVQIVGASFRVICNFAGQRG